MTSWTISHAWQAFVAFVGSMLLWAGKELLPPAAPPRRRWLINLLTVLYCVVMSILILKDVVHPIPLPHHEP